MAKDPAFLFYPGDYISGTMHLTLEEKGAYIEVLMLQFNVGHMTKHMIGRVLGQKLDTVWSSIESKFEIDPDGKYYNRRLEEEKNKRIAYTQSRRNNKKGKNQHSKATPKVGHMTSHMENEDENENNIYNGVENLNSKQAAELMSNDETYIGAFGNGIPPRRYIQFLLRPNSKGVSQYETHCKQSGEDIKPYSKHQYHLTNWARKKFEALSPPSKNKYR